MSNARVKNYVFELIRLNYISSYNFPNAKFKQLLTENLILKYFTSIVLSIDNQENLNMMSILIIEICFYTQDIKFFDKILMRILDLHNHFKEFLQESDKYNLICRFQKNTFIYLFNKLSSSFQSEKLQIFIKKIYSITKIDLKDNSLLKILLNFLKTFIINKDYEVFVDKNFCYKLNKLPSQVVLNFLALKNKNSKKIYENMKSKKINIYEPYLYLKHNKIFEFLIEVLKSDLTNTYIGEEILELFLIYTKSIFFFKCIPNEILLKIILDEENLKKYLTNKKFFELLVGLIAISPFNYFSFAAQGPLNAKNIIKSSYEFFKKDITKKILSEIISMHSDKLKDKMLDLSLNSLKEILKSMKNMSTNYKKSLNNQLNRRDISSSSGNSGNSSSSTANNSNVSANFVHQNIFIGLNNPNAPGPGLQGNPVGSSAGNGLGGLYQNAIVFFNPKEKIINLNSMTEANTKEDNIGNYKDITSRSQVNFKNCKQYMNKVLVLVRIYMQSYFQVYMSSVLNEYLKLNCNSNSNINGIGIGMSGYANQFGIGNNSNSVSGLFGNSNVQGILNALLQINNLNNLNGYNINNYNGTINNNNFGGGNNVNGGNNLNILLANLASLQSILVAQQQNPLLAGLNLNSMNFNNINNNNSLAANNAINNLNQMQNNLLQNGNFNTNNNNLNPNNNSNLNNNNYYNMLNNSFGYSSLQNNTPTSLMHNNNYNNYSPKNINNQNINLTSSFTTNLNQSKINNSFIQNSNNNNTINNQNQNQSLSQSQNQTYNLGSPLIFQNSNFIPNTIPNNSNINSIPNIIFQNQNQNTNNILNFSNKLINSNFYNLDSVGKDQHVGLNPGEAERVKHLSAFYTSFLESLYDIRNLAYFKPSVAISVLYTLFSLKEVLSKFGDELILKTIYLVLNLGWTQYETEIHKIFNENFNIKFRKFEYEKIRSFETPLKKEFINFLSDVVVYSLVDKISIGHNILSTFNAIFRNKNSRESIFLDICRWNVVSNSIRDNMKNEYRNKMQENSQVFIGMK